MDEFWTSAKNFNTAELLFFEDLNLLDEPSNAEADNMATKMDRDAMDGAKSSVNSTLQKQHSFQCNLEEVHFVKLRNHV